MLTKNKMFKTPCFIAGKTLEDQLMRTIRIFGNRELRRFVQENKIKIDPKTAFLLEEKTDEAFSWEALVTPDCVSLFNIDGLDLIRKLMAMHPDERLTVEEALAHPFLK